MGGLLKEMEKKITGARTCSRYNPGVYGDSDQNCYGLAPEDGYEPPGYVRPNYSHYVVRGEGFTTGEAMGGFWLDYKSQGPYGDGDIFWRTDPSLIKENVFYSKNTVYVIIARFSIKNVS